MTAPRQQGREARGPPHPTQPLPLCSDTRTSAFSQGHLHFAQLKGTMAVVQSPQAPSNGMTLRRLLSLLSAPSPQSSDQGSRTGLHTGCRNHGLPPWLGEAVPSEQGKGPRALESSTAPSWFSSQSSSDPVGPWNDTAKATTEQLHSGLVSPKRKAERIQNVLWE